MPVGRGGIAVGLSIMVVGIFVVGIILAGSAPVPMYRVTACGSLSWLTGTVVVAQVTAITWLLTSKLAVWHRAVLTAGMLLVLTAVFLMPGVRTRSVGLAVGGISHFAAYSSLLTWFAGSLRRGREPVVTGFARRMRRTMPVKVVRYTRRVTIAWSIFFAAQLGASTVLLAVAPEATWWYFVNLLNLPLIAAMVLAEFGCRLLLFRHEPRTGLIATLAGLRHIRSASGGRT